MSGESYAEGVGTWQATSKGDATLERVRALLASASDESYPEDLRESYRLRAEALMFKHRIDLASATGETSIIGTDPVWRTFDLTHVSSEFKDDYLGLAMTILHHCELRGRLDYADGRQKLVMHVVGYPADLGYFDLLLTSALLAFGGRLEPKWDTSVSMDENIYRLRAAGLERGKIARRAWPEKFENQPRNFVDKRLNKRVTAIFEREAAKRDEQTEGLVGRGVNVATYRRSYAEAFVNELWSRLSRMRLSRGQDSAALVLKSVKERVDEAFYTRYPKSRPKVPVFQANGGSPKPPEPCPKCKAAKSGHCREHPKGSAHKERPWSAAGYARGEAAAQTVELGPWGPRPSRQRQQPDRDRAVMFRRWLFWHRLMRQHAKPEQNWDFLTARIQYSALHPDGSRTIYPSEAAYRNDPVWNRRNGAITYGRAIDANDKPLGPWRRTYVGDIKAHRGED